MSKNGVEEADDGGLEAREWWKEEGRNRFGLEDVNRERKEREKQLEEENKRGKREEPKLTIYESLKYELLRKFIKKLK